MIAPMDLENRSRRRGKEEADWHGRERYKRGKIGHEGRRDRHKTISKSSITTIENLLKFWFL